nr:MAG TPA: hypothetical protein [Caudoviricetes sp.]
MNFLYLGINCFLDSLFKTLLTAKHAKKSFKYLYLQMHIHFLPFIFYLIKQGRSAPFCQSTQKNSFNNIFSFIFKATKFLSGEY